MPKGHDLAAEGRLTLRALAAHPIITYSFSFSGPSSLHDAFEKAHLVPDIAITARDSDVIKIYVRLGLGVGIIASMAIDPERDSDLETIDAEHLLPAHTTWIGFRRGLLLRRYMYDFIQLLAPHLDRRIVDRANLLPSKEAVAELLSDRELPLR